MKRFVALFIAIAMHACGSESSDVVNNPGSGSGTLKITATISAEEKFSNAPAPENFKVDITVKVWDSQERPVEDALIKVFSAKNELTVPHDEKESYKAQSIMGYDRIYTLSISRGNDFIEGLTVTGPKNHTISIGNPSETPTSIKASEPVIVLWNPYGYAESVKIESLNFKTTQSDSGRFEIPAGNFTPGTPDFIRITREKSLNPEGAIAGSIFTVKITNKLDPVTVVQ